MARRSETFVAAELGAAFSPLLDRPVDELSPVERGVLLKFGASVPHPRGYGNNARVLGRYVRELKVLRLEAMPLVINAFVTGEVSSNAGGLIRWPVFALAGVVQIFAGAQFYRGAWRQLKAGNSNMDTLVALGSTFEEALGIGDHPNGTLDWTPMLSDKAEHDDDRFAQFSDLATKAIEALSVVQPAPVFNVNVPEQAPRDDTVLVAVMLGGKVAGGSRRWLPLGPFSFQPAELVKIAIILVMAAYFSRRPRTEALRFKDLLATEVKGFKELQQRAYVDVLEVEREALARILLLVAAVDELHVLRLALRDLERIHIRRAAGHDGAGGFNVRHAIADARIFVAEHAHERAADGLDGLAAHGDVPFGHGFQQG